LGNKLNFGYLNVDSDPKGATVSIKDKVIGTTPFKEIEVESGTHTLNITLNNYVSQEKTIFIENKKVNELYFKMSPTEMYLNKKNKETAAKKAGLKKYARVVAAGFTVAGLGAAGYFHYDWDKKYTLYQDSDDPAEKGDLHTKIRAAETNRLITAIIGGVGAVGLGVTYVF
jgi:hypothetical protein